MNPRYGTHNSPTSILKLLHVSTHIIGFHFWKVCSQVFASYLCLSPIYCLTHVECFRFFMAANIDFVWSKFAASFRHAHASLRPGLQPCLQLARIMECGLNSLSLLTRRRRTPLVLELPLWLTVDWYWLVNRAVRPERSSRLLSNVHLRGVVGNNLAGPLNRPSSSTIASLDDITYIHLLPVSCLSTRLLDVIVS